MYLLRLIFEHFGPFVRSLRLEPFVLFYSASLSLSDITATQMIQDKICIFQYNRSVEYCAKISDQQLGSDDDFKPQILAHLTVYNMYRTLISTLPSIVFALFLGTWTDNYIHGRKILLCLNTLGYMTQYALLLFNAIDFSTDVLYILICYIPSAFTGSWVCAVMAGYSYVSHNSPPKYRIIKFTLYHITGSIANQIGTFVGGRLLGKAYDHGNGRLYNYETVFITSIVGLSIALIWLLIVVNEKKKQNEEESNLIINNENNNNNNESNILDKYDHQIDVRAVISSDGDINNNRSQFLRIFDFNNVREVIKTCFKSRPNKGRAQILLLYLSMCCVMFAELGKDGILFQYVEEVFYWNAEQYSTVKSIASFAQLLPICIIVPILSKRLRIKDVNLGIIGVISLFSGALVLGTIISPLGLYLSYAFGSLNGVSSLSIRSLLSKIANETEIGKVFSLLAVLETMMPAIMSAVYNAVFDFTIKSYPSASFHMAASVIFIPLSILIWIDLSFN